MKLRSIRFENHEIFNNLQLNFTNTEGHVLDTIIIAGENGVGKSQLLNAIYELVTGEYSNNIRNQKTEFEIQISEGELEYLLRSQHGQLLLSNKNLIFKIQIDYSATEFSNRCKAFRFVKNQLWQGMPPNFFFTYDTAKVFTTIFSDTQTNFDHFDAKTITTKNIDNKSHDSRRSNSKITAEITQLLVDIQTLDALDFMEWAKNNPTHTIEKDKLEPRLSRFSNAFNFMFPFKKLKGIRHTTDMKQVIFEEHGKEMSINQLSSGEKQIVFRGGFLLKDIGVLKDSLVLIDEPELSLHPNWQIKILNFFKKLFINTNGEQKNQLIIATHSPFIIHNFNRNNDKVIILQKNKEGEIKIPEDPKFFAWSTEKIIKEAFNVLHQLSPNETTVFVEGETDEMYFTKALQVYKKMDLQIKFKWIGRINESGNAENSGDTALNSAKVFFISNTEQIKGKVVLLYDNDTNKPEEYIDNLSVRSMSLNKNNTIFKKGIENLLTLIKEIDVKDFYKEKIKEDDYGAKSVIRELDKRKLCNFICEGLSEDNQKKVLSYINDEIDILLKLNNLQNPPFQNM